MVEDTLKSRAPGPTDAAASVTARLRMFDRVMLACDQWTLDVVTAVRGALELFRLHVYLHFCVQKRNLLDVLAGRIPDAGYVVLCFGETVKVVDQVNGKWVAAEFTLTPETVRDQVRLPGRSVVALGCHSGRKEIADAFLAAGSRSYIGAATPVDQDSTALFAIAFFYHLLSSERDSTLACTEQQAFERAAAVDRPAREGTHVFRRFARGE